MSEEEILTLFPYEWVEKDEYTDDDRIAIHVWCMDQDSKPYFLRIEDFPVLCYVELPMILQGQYRQWNNSMAKKFMSYLNYRLKEHAAIDYNLLYMKKTYYYMGELTYPMLLLKFKSLKALRHCENILKYTLNTKDFGYIKCNIWEHKIPTTRKLLTNQYMSYSEWFTVRGKKVESDLRLSSLDEEYIVQWKTIRPIPTEICDKWRIYPRILSFDIECYSDNKRVFPDAWCVKHVAYMISCIFQVYNRVETRMRYAIILGPCADIPKEKLCNTEIIHVETEEELVNAFADLILTRDPEIITGYNIFGFDYKYLHVRLIQQLLEWPVMGRLLGEKAVMKDQEWSSGAYGHQIIYDLKMDGRINVDLLPIIKRDYKLLKYTLDFVAEHFLGSHKHDITAPDMFWIYEELNEAQKWFLNTKTSVESKFKGPSEQFKSAKFIELTGQLEKLFNPCLWRTKTEVFELYNHCDEFINDYYVQHLRGWKGHDGEKKYPYLDFRSIFTLFEENESFFKEINIDKVDLLRYVLASMMMTFVLLYCIQDSELVLDLIERLNVFLGLVQMSNVTGVSIVELFTRGQQLRCMSLLYDIAVKEGYVIDGAAKPGYNYTGGFVYTPIPGLHENVMCWDFSSLYPTIIMAYNIDYTTLVHPSFEDQVPDEYCNIIEFDQEEEITIPPETEGEEPKVEIVTKHYRFKYLNAKKTGRKGLLPQLEHKMVASRRAVRALLKTEKDPIMRIVYHQRQLAIKVVCNSFYGFLGVQKGGKMPLIEGAMSITAKARQSILKVSDYVSEKHGGKVVYGDTDSVMADLGIVDPLEAVKKGKELEKELSDLFPDPMNMELEKVMRIFCLKKKRYIYAEVDFKTGELKLDLKDLKYKGIELARRDRPKWLRDVQAAVIQKIMRFCPFIDSFDLVIESIDKLLASKIPCEDLITVKGLNATYKNKSFHMAVFAEELKKLGKPAQPGSRLEYLVVIDEEAHLLGQRQRLPETYLERLGTEEEEELDYMYYIEKILMNPISQLLTIAYKDTIKKLEDIKFRPTKRHKFVGFDEPILLLYSMIKYGQDHHQLKEAVKYELQPKTISRSCLNIIDLK